MSCVVALSKVPGKSPSLSNKTPRTGTAVSATSVEASRAKLTDKAKGVKNSPTSPCIKARGTNTATVVKVDDTIAAPTSLVPSTAAWYRSSPRCMCLYIFSRTTILSSTTLPTAMASPARLIKLSDRPYKAITKIPVITLSGIEIPIIKVGLSVVATPLNNVGRMLMRKIKTADTANKNPSVPSLSNDESCLLTSGPSFCITRTFTSGGNPSIVSSFAIIPSVTSTVLASGFFKTAIFILGLPLVLEIVVASSVSNVIEAISFSRTILSPRLCPATGTATSFFSKPIAKSLRSSMDPNSLVVLTKKLEPSLSMVPDGKLALLPAMALDICVIENPRSSAFCVSTVTITCSSISPATLTSNTPSTLSIAGIIWSSITR